MFLSKEARATWPYTGRGAKGKPPPLPRPLPRPSPSVDVFPVPPLALARPEIHGVGDVTDDGKDWLDVTFLGPGTSMPTPMAAPTPTSVAARLVIGKERLTGTRVRPWMVIRATDPAHPDRHECVRQTLTGDAGMSPVDFLPRQGERPYMLLAISDAGSVTLQRVEPISFVLNDSVQSPTDINESFRKRTESKRSAPEPKREKGSFNIGLRIHETYKGSANGRLRGGSEKWAASASRDGPGRRSRGGRRGRRAGGDADDGEGDGGDDGEGDGGDGDGDDDTAGGADDDGEPAAVDYGDYAEDDDGHDDIGEVDRKNDYNGFADASSDAARVNDADDGVDETDAEHGSKGATAGNAAGGSELALEAEVRALRAVQKAVPGVTSPDTRDGKDDDGGGDEQTESDNDNDDVGGDDDDDDDDDDDGRVPGAKRRRVN